MDFVVSDFAYGWWIEALYLVLWCVAQVKVLCLLFEGCREEYLESYNAQITNLLSSRAILR